MQKKNSVLKYFTLNKFLGTLFGLIVIAGTKYLISGYLTFYVSDLINNIGIALFGWAI